MNDEAVIAAVPAESERMEDLLVRLVKAPTVLGEEEAGQALMEAVFADCNPGIHSVSLPIEMCARVEEAIAEAAPSTKLAENQPQVRYDGFSCEGITVDHGFVVVHTLSEAYARLHGNQPFTIATIATIATTDARHFVHEGIPAVCFGSQGERIQGIPETPANNKG